MKYKLALVHDYLDKIGGAETTLMEMASLWERAPIYTMLYQAKNFPKKLKNPVIESNLKRFRNFFSKKRKYTLPFISVTPETYDLRKFDIVLSSSGAFSKGVITNTGTMHVCYCHSPTRYVWDSSHEYLKSLALGKLRDLLTRFILNYLRMWDVLAADRVDYFIANSKATQQKIKKYYRKDSKVIYPPVAVNLFNKNVQKYAKKKINESYFLIVSRLSAYKNLDIVVNAFNKLGWKLIIIGDGEQLKYLRSIKADNIKILGYQSRAQVIKYMKNCFCYIQASHEDFGIAAIEALAAGKPVLALEKGAAKEYIKPQFNGELFETPSIEVLAQGAYNIKKQIKNYDETKISQAVEKFSTENFKNGLKDFIEEKWQEYKNNYAL
jgi:glycosyltransferase involved in cell wall biosynthesis